MLDTNGDGKITRPWNVQIGRGDSVVYQGDTHWRDSRRDGEQTAFDPKLDTMISYSMYSVIPSPVDDSVWGVSETFPGYLVRLQRGNNAPSTCKTQIFKVPEPGFDPRGVDIDSNGVVWTALAASSHLASFDVRKCKDLNGPAKTDGSQCREGWTLYQTTGPKLKGTEIPSDFHYYNWVDQHNISGLGANTPFANGSNSDALLAAQLRRRASGPRSACRTRSGSTRAEWTAASTIRTPDGRAARYTRTTARISCGTSRVEKEPRPRSSRCRFDRIHWRGRATFGFSSLTISA